MNYSFLGLNFIVKKGHENWLILYLIVAAVALLIEIWGMSWDFRI